MSKGIKKSAHIAIVLAGGKGTRMKSSIPKQYLLLEQKPVLYYALQAFEESFIDEIILVVDETQKEYCQKEIIEKNQITKVTTYVSPGLERYQSVYHAILAIENDIQKEKRIQPDYLYIHDGARPFLNQEMLKRLKREVRKNKACVAAVPVKDTIKIADEQGCVIDTPKRNNTYQIQTPQVFSYPLIQKAYDSCIQAKDEKQITDDAMVVENYTTNKIWLVEGDYHNIKITTPEDMFIAEAFLAQEKKKDKA